MQCARQRPVRDRESLDLANFTSYGVRSLRLPPHFPQRGSSPLCTHFRIRAAQQTERKIKLSGRGDAVDFHVERPVPSRNANEAARGRV
jgi:hypothetical protein